MREVLGKITEETWVPLGLVILMIVVAMWLTGGRDATAENSRQILEIKTRQDAQDKVVQSVDVHLAHIDEKLEALRRAGR